MLKGKFKSLGVNGYIMFLLRNYLCEPQFLWKCCNSYENHLFGVNDDEILVILTWPNLFVYINS